MTSAPSRLELVARARAAMALRGSVLSLVAGAPLDGADRDRITRAGAGAWSLLLAAECCALPVAARLRAAGMLDQLAPDAARAVADAERRELQRVMAARAALIALDEAASAIGVEPVVLKGGALAADGAKSPLDLGDVDLLLDGDGAARLWDQLRGTGWTERAERGVSPLDVDDGSQNHLRPLVPPGGGLPVELHRRVRYGDAAAESAAAATSGLRGCRALRVETGAAVVARLLEHSVVHHPHRRGHLRDLVLVADALAACDEAERRRARERIAATRFAPELREMLACAEAVAAGRAIADPPSVRRAVARKYLLVLGDDARLSARMPAWWNVTHIALERRALRASLYAGLLRDAFARVPATSMFRVRGLARRLPAVAPAVAWTSRAASHAVYAAVAALAGVSVRRRVDAVLRADAPV